MARIVLVMATCLGMMVEAQSQFNPFQTSTNFNPCNGFNPPIFCRGFGNQQNNLNQRFTQVTSRPPIVGQACLFGGKTWQDKQKLEGTCFKFTCRKGDWIYDKKAPSTCGMSQVDGDPHVHTWTPMPNTYILSLIGEFSIVQPGKKIDPEYGVKGGFGPCTDDQGNEKTCITSITYDEPGIKIKLVAEPKHCNGHPLTDPNCQIKVLVNTQSVQVDTTVKTLSALEGPLLVFKSAGIPRPEDMNCITIVGTKGLSMSLCAVKNNFPYLYIWAMPSLKTNPSTLFGLCNIYTGVRATKLVPRNNAIVDATNVDVSVCGEIPNTNPLCLQFAESWKL